MKRQLFFLMALLVLFLTSCTKLGEKTASATFVYGAMALFAALLLVGYLFFVRKKHVWMIVLFSCIAVVNGAYFALSISSRLEEALWANRVAYLASVFLLYSTVMIVLKIGDLKYPRWLPHTMGGVCLAAFLVAASQGFCDLYYREVSLFILNGVSMLEKTYGPLHTVYSCFLLLAFLAIIVCTVLVFAKHRLAPRAQSGMLAAAVFINLAV